MPTSGQAELYNPTYRELAREYCLVGATDEVLADYFGVSRCTIQSWIATHPDFADAVRMGRVVASQGRSRPVRARHGLPRKSHPHDALPGRKAHHHHHDMPSPRHPGLHVLAEQPTATVLAGGTVAGSGSRRRRPGGDGGALAG
jgi:hypothetical protein